MSNDFGYETADPNNIVVVENFVSAEHVQLAVKYCQTISDWAPKSSCGTDKISPATTMKRENKELYTIMCDYLDTAKMLIEYKFGRKVERAFPGLRRWDVGDSQDPHADGETFDGVPTETYMDDYGSIIYLNDDYEGGELRFPGYDLAIKPKPGTFIFFPSSVYYVHEVLPIARGVRYTSPHFWVPVKHNVLVKLAKESYEADIPHAHSENVWH